MNLPSQEMCRERNLLGFPRSQSNANFSSTGYIMKEDWLYCVGSEQSKVRYLHLYVYIIDVW